ncbi:MAG: type II secretion system protein [bacterium]
MNLSPLRKNRGFTLIELLATLTIMAIMSAMLFPFIGNYIARANQSTNFRSLKLVDDAMGRFQALKFQSFDQIGIDRWGLQDADTAGADNNMLVMSAALTQNILTDIQGKNPTNTSGFDQTLQIPPDGLTTNNLIIIRQGGLLTRAWSTWRYRRKVDRDGVNRKNIVVPATDFMTWTVDQLNADFSGN